MVDRLGRQDGLLVLMAATFGSVAGSGEDAGVTALDQAGSDSARAHPLDSVVWSSLTGPHARFAEGATATEGTPGATGPESGAGAESPAGVLRYRPDVSSFAAFAPGLDGPPELEDARWAVLAALVGPGGDVTLSGPARTIVRLPAGWRVALRIEGVQMIATQALVCGPDPEVVVLGADDVPEMLDLVRRTEPGPFQPRTHEMGTYLGIRRGGVLVSMAGERMHPPGWVEVSAVCTDRAFRGQGLAGRLIRAVAHGIRERGETPFLHTGAGNAAAIGLYQSLGFTVRLHPEFFFLRAPA